MATSCRSKTKYLRLVLFICLSLISVGCAPKNVKIQVYDKQFIAPNRTDLVAGLKRVNDERPAKEKELDQYYEKANPVVINEILYKNLKMSGMFKDVLFEEFEQDKVDVILDPALKHFFYERRSNGWTAFNLLFAFTGIPALIYQLAGGPNGEHYAEANIKLSMLTSEGKILASGIGEKVLSVNSNLHNTKSDGIGILEGRALTDAAYDAALSLSNNVKLNTLPAAKFGEPKSCGSDKDCKGVRICAGGVCINPTM
jgi:hypothetical protein